MNDAAWMEAVNVAERKVYAAESRIAAALACHTLHEWTEPTTYIKARCRCGCLWDTVNDRCTSPTVRALLGSDGGEDPRLT